MIQEAFIGPVIHTDENGTLIIIKRAGILVEDGKVYYVFHIFSAFNQNEKIILMIILLSNSD